MPPFRQGILNLGRDFKIYLPKFLTNRCPDKLEFVLQLQDRGHFISFIRFVIMLGMFLKTE